jgi:hypothetical protein
MRDTWLGLACIAVLAACARQPDEEAIRATIVTIAEAAEARDGTDILEHVSADFTGNDGEFDRRKLADLLRMQLIAGSLGVHLGQVDVELSGARATARFDATLTDGSGRWIAERSAGFRFVTGWRREDGAWRCYNASWERVGL